MNFFRKSKNKGSLTVEACIALPVFLCFFYLLLFIAKIACINIILDHAVKETVQQVAAVSYPLRLVNEYIDLEMDNGADIDQFFAKGFNKASDLCVDKTKESVIRDILTGKINMDTLKNQFGKIRAGKIKGAEIAKSEMVQRRKQDIQQLFIQDIYNMRNTIWVNISLPLCLELKQKGQYYVATEIFEKYSQNNYIDLDKLEITIFELPQSCAEYKIKKKELSYWESNLEPDIDFNFDDVVLQVEYKCAIPLPFFGKRDILLRHTAVEKAWLNGSNGICAANKEDERVDLDDYSQSEQPEKYDAKEEVEEYKKDKIKDDLDKYNEENINEEEEYVYICKSATNVYHKYPFCDYLNNTGKRMPLKDAQKKGMRPHAGCPRRFR